MKEELPSGMTKIPYGWPLMAGAFIGAAEYLGKQEGIFEDFQKDTGHDMSFLLNRTGLDKIIDQATGIEKELFGAYLDWIVINHWGEEGDPRVEGEDF